MKTLAGIVRVLPALVCAIWAVDAYATTCIGQSCTVTIATDPTAPNGNFGTPGTTANVGYTISTNDNGAYFSVILTSTDPSALPFANLYFDTIASTPNTGSNLGFEFGQTPSNDDTFIPGVPGSNQSIAGMGITASFVVGGGTTTGYITIPNSFFLTDPTNSFAPTPNGTLVSLHLSQSFSYSVVGGSGNYPAPVELGAALVSGSPAPEPSFYLLLGIGIAGLLVLGTRKRTRRTAA